MPRQARKQSKSGAYHIMLRGINRQDLFHDNEDMGKLIGVLEACAELGKAQIHAYCLMANHVHIMAQTGSAPDAETLAQVMKRIGIRYAQYYNYKYRRVGALFQDRFKSEEIETNEYFLTVLRYIHRNPVKAGIVKLPFEYSWSSYDDYIRRDGFVYTDMGIALLGEGFETFMNEDDKIACLDMSEASARMTDLELSAKIEEMVHLPVPIIASMERKARNEVLRQIIEIKGATYRQISRVTGVSIGALQNAAGEYIKKVLK